MPQSVTVQRGQVGLSNGGGYATIFTAPAGCIATRVIIGGLRVVASSGFAATRLQLLHYPSGSSYPSPVKWYTQSTGGSAQGISFVDFDGAPNGYYTSSYQGAGISVRNYGSALNPGAFGSSWEVGFTSSAAGIQNNNIKNLWIGPNDTLRIAGSSNGVSSYTCQYFFISIAES